MNHGIARPPALASWRDADTGVLVERLTDGPEPAGPLYFTRGSWTHDGSRLLFLRARGGRQELCAAGLDGEIRALTDLPAAPTEPRFVRHMNRVFLAEEIDKLMLRLPAVHPHRPLLAYAWRGEIRLLDLDGGGEELLHQFDGDHSGHPATGLHTVFTADGRDLLLVTTRAAAPDEPRLDPPGQHWDFTLRDESRMVGAIWRFDLAQRRLHGPLFRSNGEQSHLLTCPWDARLVVWVNYLHGTLYAMRLGDDGPRALLATRAGDLPNHYAWDTANRRLACCVGMGGAHPVRLVSIDPATGAGRDLTPRTWPSPGHIAPSPDGRWLAMDAPLDGYNGLTLVDQRDGAVHRLCRIDCSWSPAFTDEQGGPVKSELLHPNPCWSPDGRWIAFGSDFGTGVGQLHLVDMATRIPS